MAPSIDAERARQAPVAIHVVLLLVPTGIDFVPVIPLILTLLEWILSVLGEKKMLPDLGTRQASRLGDIKLLG